MSEQEQARVDTLEALYTAHEFIESVTAWTGHPDDQQEAREAVDDAIAKLNPPESEATPHE